MNREQIIANMTGMLDHLDLNSYDAIINWLTMFAPYTNEPIVADQKEKVTRVLNKVSRTIEETLKASDNLSENVKAVETKKIVDNAVKYLSNNEDFNKEITINDALPGKEKFKPFMSALEDYREKFADKTKGEIIAKLKELKTVLPSERFDIDQAIEELERERISLAESIMNSDPQAVSANSEREALVAQIELKEQEVTRLKTKTSSAPAAPARNTEEVLTELDTLNGKISEYYKKIYTPGISKEEQDKLVDLSDEVIQEREKLIKSITNDKDILDLFDKIEDLEVKLVNIWEELQENRTPEKRKEHWSASADLGENKYELRNAIEKVLKSAKTPNTAVENKDYEVASKELEELKKRLSSIEQKDKEVKNNSDRSKYDQLSKKSEALKLLRKKGITSTQTYVSELIADFENGAITKVELNAKLIELKQNASYLYGFSEEERKQELQEIAVSKESTMSEIKRLELKLANPDSYNKKNNYSEVELDKNGMPVTPLIKNEDYYNPEMRDYNLFVANREYNHYKEKIKELEMETTAHSGKQAENELQVKSIKRQLELERKALSVTKQEESAMAESIRMLGYSEKEGKKYRELENKLAGISKEIDQLIKATQARPEYIELNNAKKNLAETEALMGKEQDSAKIEEYKKALIRITDNITSLEDALRGSYDKIASMNQQKKAMMEEKSRLEKSAQERLSEEDKKHLAELEEKLAAIREEITRAENNINTELPKSIEDLKSANKDIENKKSELKTKMDRYAVLKTTVDEKIHDENKKSMWHKRIDELHLYRLQRDLSALSEREKYLNSGINLDELIELTGGEKKKEEEIKPVPVIPIEPEKKVDPTSLAGTDQKKEDEDKKTPTPVTGSEAEEPEFKDEPGLKEKFITWFNKNKSTILGYIIAAVLSGGVGFLIACFVLPPLKKGDDNISTTPTPPVYGTQTPGVTQTPVTPAPTPTATAPAETPDATQKPDPTKNPDPTKKPATPTPSQTQPQEPDPTNRPDPTNKPTPEPTTSPTPDPTNSPTPDPTVEPTPSPTPEDVHTGTLQRGDYIASRSPDGSIYFFTHKDDPYTILFIYNANPDGSLSDEAWVAFEEFLKSQQNDLSASNGISKFVDQNVGKSIRI